MASALDWRRLIFAALLALMTIGSVSWTLFELPFIDRGPLEQAVAAIPDRATPEYPLFLAEVRARTGQNDLIAIAVPRRWHSGYEYAFYRATYFLPGRSVVPLLDDGDRMYLERVNSVDYVAAWSTPFESPEFTTVWRGHNGLLARRRR